MSRVLVVEDEWGEAEALRELLQVHGHEVRVAHDGEVALRMLEEGPRPDVLVLDLMLPVLDGRELLRRLRLDPRWVQLPVVVATAAHVRPAERALVSATLAKPFALAALLAALRGALGAA